MTAIIGSSTSLPVKTGIDPSVELVIHILTHINENDAHRIQELFHRFAEMIADIHQPLAGTPFEHINAFFASSGGLTMCLRAWQHRSMDLERVYYLCLLGRLLRVDILSKIDAAQLRTEEAKHLYFFLEELCQVSLREELEPGKVHELSEFMETEYSNLQQELPLQVFLKTMQAINLFTLPSNRYLAAMPLTCADAIRYWINKIPLEERFPTCAEFDEIMVNVKDHHFNRNVGEERFEEDRWRAFHFLNKLSETQLGLWSKNGEAIKRNHTALMRRMKRGTGRMIRVCAIDTKCLLEKQKTESVLERLVILIKKIVRWIIGAQFHHPNFLTYLPEHHTYAVHGKDEGDGVYCEQESGNPKRHIREYEINISSLLPEGVDSNKFEREFLETLERIVLIRNSHLKLPNRFRLALHAIIPRFRATQPSEVNLSDGIERVMSCNQFVLEALIQAHVETCRKFDAQIPDSLAYYGFKRGDNTAGMTPTYMMEGLIRKQILRECYSPFIR